MEPLKRLLFEEPYLQVIIGGIAFLVALAGWWWARKQGGNPRPWAIVMTFTAMITGAGEVAQWIVVTDREQITAQLDRAAVAVEHADAKTVLSLTDDNLLADGRSREQFGQWLEGILRRIKVRSPSIHRLEIEFASRNVAHATVGAMATIESCEYAGIVGATWKIEFDRIDDTWKIVALDLVENAKPFP